MMLRSAFHLRILLVVFFCTALVPGNVVAETDKPPVIRSLDVLALQGSWVRTDSPYVIELRHTQDGSLKASYFNPKPINVGKTETAEQGGMVQVMIELQDVNYPGSTYVLSYDRTHDLLEGIYFHPKTKQSYPVSFVRKPTQQ
jgi:hypothetical protein